jgi:hypothetical protein
VHDCLRKLSEGARRRNRILANSATTLRRYQRKPG